MTSLIIIIITFGYFIIILNYFWVSFNKFLSYTNFFHKGLVRRFTLIQDELGFQVRALISLTNKETHLLPLIPSPSLLCDSKPPPGGFLPRHVRYPPPVDQPWQPWIPPSTLHGSNRVLHLPSVASGYLNHHQGPPQCLVPAVSPPPR